MNIANLLHKRAYLTPNRQALLNLECGQNYTYAQLNTRANCLAHHLQTHLHIQKGDRIAILAHNSVAYIDHLFAAAKIGAIFTPLNWRLHASELTYIINNCQPTLLSCGPEFVNTLTQIQPNLNITHYFSLEGAEITGATAYQDIIQTPLPNQPELPFFDNSFDEKTPCCIFYTSGTSGQPKGAIITHQQILWNCINTVASWGLSEKDTAPIFTPLFHVGGLFVFLTPLFYVGGRIVMARTFNPEASLQTIQDQKCTVILGVPTLFQMWMNASNFSHINFSYVRFFISGGAPCPPALITNWQKTTNVTLRQGYGLTEVGPNCFTMTNQEATHKAGSVGKPIFHSHMRLIDQQGNYPPNGQVGELLIKGSHVCAGYWGNPEATATALQDGWFHTGDMAYQDKDGFFYISGRFKDMIISGGENIYAAEVEAIFLEHPAVSEAALIAKPDEKWGEVGLMIVVLKQNQTVSPETLQAFCKERLARYKIPKQVIFTNQLPYSPYGKVIKAELRKRFIKNNN